MKAAIPAALACLCLSVPVAAAGQPVTGPTAARSEALSWLTGRWRGPGVTMGNADAAQLEIKPALGGAFIEFSYRAGRFEGRALYRAGEGGSWTATWFDNRGVSFPIAAVAEGRTLTADWGSAATERGRTVYRLAEDGRLHVTDAVFRPDGSYREFASHLLTRSE